MKCKDCGNFKSENNIEAGAAILPNVQAMSGRCAINDKSCGAMDKCGCGGFVKR
ncbi:MAG: hypothetical protein N3B21_15810 [Clostridia bacterium]|nr:hypothetical protein [Clostridia bacterium]